MLQGLTAHYLCHDTFPLKPNDTCLVHAGAGGVGLLLIQMCHRIGARVVTTVSTEEKAKLAREAGADHVVLYTKQDFVEETLRFTGGKIVAPLAFTGSYSILTRCVQFKGTGTATVDLSFDAGKQKVFGALNVMDDSQKRPFTDDDVQVLGLFADLASIVIKKSELYAQIMQFSQDLEHKVQTRTRELMSAQTELTRKAEELQQLLARTVRIQEEERTRIARDLHDESSQLITATLYEIQAAQASIDAQRAAVARGKLDTAKQHLRTMDATMRRMVSGLRPPVLDAQGLIPALKWLAAHCLEQYRLGCEVYVSGKIIRLGRDAETAIFRIVQESLSNVAAHARATHVAIRADFGTSTLRVVVEDDGVGFTPQSVLQGGQDRAGLIGMRERAQSIGGLIEVQSAPGYGTRVVLEVPLPPADVAVC